MRAISPEERGVLVIVDWRERRVVKMLACPVPPKELDITSRRVIDIPEPEHNLFYDPNIKVNGVALPEYRKGLSKPSIKDLEKELLHKRRNIIAEQAPEDQRQPLF